MPPAPAAVAPSPERLETRVGGPARRSMRAAPERSTSRTLLLACALFAAPAVAHAAAVSAPGVNLRWDRCYGDGGVWNKTFACDTNIGTEQVVGSFELAQNVNRVVTAVLVLDVRSASPTLPAWWELKNSGTCRQTALDFSTFAYPDPVTCLDWSASPTGGGISVVSIGSQGPSHLRVNAAVAVLATNAVNMLVGQEYFLFRLIISHQKTVGTGACAGCDVPVCLFLSRVSLYQVGSSSAAINLEKGANWLGSQYVTWQNGYPIDAHRECEPPEATCATHYTAFGCVLSSPTKRRVATWGQVKALYR